VNAIRSYSICGKASGSLTRRAFKSTGSATESTEPGNQDYKNETPLGPLGNFFLMAGLGMFERLLRLYFREEVPHKYGLYFANPSDITLYFPERRPLKPFRPWSVSKKFTKLEVASELHPVGRRNWRVIEEAIVSDPTLQRYRLWEESAPQSKTAAAKRIRTTTAIVQELRSTRYFRTQQELRPGAKHFRERGGITVVVDQNGDLILSSGRHRFAIARALKIPTVPVAVLYSHPQSIRRGQWRKNLRLHR
jgi:hypothetical protein